MIIEWLFIGVLILAAINLIIFAVLGFLIFKQINPILEQERTKPTFLKARDLKWFGLMEEWLNDAYHAHPDSKTGLMQVRKQLRKQKEGNQYVRF